MLLLRAVLLEILVCFHVVGAAVLFRRLFPRESPWLAFIVPTLFVMSLFNFIEHYIALPNLGWLLPFTLGGLGWAVTHVASAASASRPVKVARSASPALASSSAGKILKRKKERCRFCDFECDDRREVVMHEADMHHELVWNGLGAELQKMLMALPAKFMADEEEVRSGAPVDSLVIADLPVEIATSVLPAVESNPVAKESEPKRMRKDSAAVAASSLPQASGRQAEVVAEKSESRGGGQKDVGLRDEAKLARMQKGATVKKSESSRCCPICDRGFGSRQQMLLHAVADHRTKLDCTFCDKVFGSQGHMVLHASVVHGVRLDCSHCGKLFEDQKDLLAHAEAAHPPRAQAAEQAVPARRQIKREPVELEVGKDQVSVVDLVSDSEEEEVTRRG